MLFRTVDSIARGGEAVWLLLGRIALGVLFVPSGWGKIMNLSPFAERMGAKGLPVPMAWAVVGVAIEFLGGIALILGFKTRTAALLLCIFTLFAAYLGHPYWTMTDGTRLNQYIHFWKDIAIAGGFLFVFVRGAGAISLDRG